MSTQHKKRGHVHVLLFCLFVVLFSSCGSGSSQQSSPTYPYKSFLALHICGDNTLSYPVQFLQEAARNIADRINSFIAPNMGGMFVDFSLIEANSLQDTFVTFSTPAIQNIPPKPQAGNDPYSYAKALSDWEKTVPKINSLVTSVRANIKPSLDKMRSIHLQEVGGTDIPGCADTAASEFAHFSSGNKILLYISDMQGNIDVNFSKHINLNGAKVVVIFRPCQVQSACEQNDAFWKQQFTAWGSSSVSFYSPAESEAEKITF
jgi:hypothetical protein